MKQTLLTFIIALLAATGAWAQTTFTVNNLKYTVTDAATHTVERNQTDRHAHHSRHRNQREHGIQRDQHRQQCVLMVLSTYGSDHTRGSSYHRKFRIRKVLLPHGSEHPRQRN